MNSLRSWAQQIQRVCNESGKHLKQSASIRSLQRVSGLKKSLGQKSKIPKSVIIALTSLVLAAALGQRFYDQPRLSAGKIAPETIEAPSNAQVENKQATEEKRKAARNISTPMYMPDVVITDEIRRTVQSQLATGTKLRKEIGKFPFVELEKLSEPTQRYLRSAEEWQWKAIWEATQAPNSQLVDRLADAAQRQAASELFRHKNQTTLDGLSGLTNEIIAAQQRYVKARSLLQAPYDSSLFDLSDSAWQKAQTEITAALDRMLMQGIAPGLEETQLRNAITLNLQIATPPEARTIAAQILVNALKPNLIKDEMRTRQQAELAASYVEPVMVNAYRGKVIVKQGQEITPDDFILLDYFKLSRRETNWWGLIGLIGGVGSSILLFWQLEQRYHPKGLRNRDYWLVGLMCLSTPLLILIQAPSTNLPAIGVLMGTFYGSVLAVTGVGLLALMLPIAMGLTLTQWLPSTIAGLTVALLAARVRSREELAFLGLGVGVTQGVLYLVLAALSGDWYRLLGGAVLEGLLGLGWSIIAIGISPYLEHLFDVVTTLRLVELANPNRALLKRLAAETPGTFQHTLFVANLAEAAARALRCNVELVRAGTLYHDIGKMHDPLGFIENQMGGVNKHDLIDDPWQSAAIIKKHVTEGLVMARRARLPKVVQAFIPEHQGTMTIGYFHHQAQQRAQQDSSITVDDVDFRYDGPSPQSRETGIVMLADSCEAALRSLKDATPDDALNMINKILAARWKDGQLNESGLTRSEMTTIAEVFVQVWQQSNHQRIAYPKGK
ncbi:MAG: HDIG domain-containing protein [Leptolyngbya sp. Prado105]|nr:HDIG domain-containing protein [Leptolyngbya sp. Prado105]